jgi:hypothetical protein
MIFAVRRMKDSIELQVCASEHRPPGLYRSAQLLTMFPQLSQMSLHFRQVSDSAPQ